MSAVMRAEPGMRALMPLQGRKPEAPRWFEDALAIEPERSSIRVHGASIELLTWGEIGKPGLMFLHGNTAHADWWRFIAPFFAQHYRVAAPTWTGMGNSDWADRYCSSDFMAQAMAAAEAAQLYADGDAPVVVAHSLGGLPARLMASRVPHTLRALILLDPLIRPPLGDRPVPPPPTEATRVYPTLAEAVGRFLLRPPQPFDNLYIADFIARTSLREVDGGWTWKFDPSFWKSFDRQINDHPDAQVEAARVPVGVIYGELSSLISPEALRYMRSVLGDAPIIGIPAAYHHLMIDQPLALVAALRGLLATWPGGSARGCNSIAKPPTGHVEI